MSPGAGKTQTLLWLRDFFTSLCAWTHGGEFVYLASQNTMAASIGGSTLHSYHKLSYKSKDGTTVATQKRDRNDMVPLCLRYQTLRLMFIDEFSTLGLDVFAEIDNNTSTHIRERGTWSLRSKNVKGSFGGLNVVTSRDAWQFGPIGSSSIFDNPRRYPASSGVERVATMFWTKEIDSFTRFFELTVENYKAEGPYRQDVQNWSNLDPGVSTKLAKIYVILNLGVQICLL